MKVTTYKITPKDMPMFYVLLEEGVVTYAPLGQYDWMRGLTTNRLVNSCKEKEWKCEWIPEYAKELQELKNDELAPASKETVVHPDHYNLHPSGVECIEIVRHMNFNLGNAMKYIWRCGLKDNTTDIEDLKKARFYIDDELKRLEGNNADRDNYLDRG